MSTALALISTALQIGSGIKTKSAADKAAEAAKKAGEFNAEIIERDLDLLDIQKKIVNKNYLQTDAENRYNFRGQQSTARANFAYAGVEISMGTPIQVMRQNARLFEYDQHKIKFNKQMADLQIEDRKESVRLNAELSRMEGGMAAASARTTGQVSLLQSFSQAANTAYNSGFFGQ